jgi:hypothetical protein
MTGWKQWDSLELVTHTEFQSYLQDQVVQVYAGTAARGSALGTAVSAGMVAYLTDTSVLQFYNGTAWANVSQIGDITGVTAGTALTGGGASGDVTLNVNLPAVGSAVLASPNVTGTATIAAGSVTGNLVVSGNLNSITPTELGYLTGGTANLQTQINARQLGISGGTAGQAFISNGTAAPGFGNVAAEYITTTVRTLAGTTTAYTTTAADENDVIYCLATATCTVTVPDLILVGDRIDIVRDGAGTVVIAAGTGVSSWAGAGTAGTAVTFKIDQQYNAATVLKVANNTYRVIGRITV